MIIVTQIGLVLVGIMLFFGAIQYLTSRTYRQNQEYILTASVYLLNQEMIQKQKLLAQKQEADRIQQTKIFYMDVKVTHGSAFGGFCATMNDGRRKKGVVRLDQIMLHGKHPAGKEFTYYIEDQNIEIAATDHPEMLIVRSTDESRFEIRQNGQGRDEGEKVSNAFLQKDVEYFIVLESKHEISLKAMKGC